MSQALERPTTPDWTVQVADRVESVVTSVRDKTTVPLTTVARGLVYGLIAGTLGAVALVLIAIIAVRVASYLPFHSPAPNTHGRAVWAGEGIIGGVFTFSGLVFLRRANRRKG